MRATNLIRNKWSCLPNAFSLATGIHTNDILDELGHDGSEIIFPGRVDPFCRKSFNPLELTYWALKRKITVVNLESECEISNLLGDSRIYSYKVDLMEVMEKNNGVVSGIFKGIGLHSTFWDCGQHYDIGGHQRNPIEKILMFSLVRR
jgi:hypothetical protein